MKIQSVFILPLVTLFFSSCAITYQVASDYKKDAAFQSFETYNYYNHEHNFPKGADPINMQRIEEAIDLELGYLDYEKTDDPDLLISWFVTVETAIQIDYYKDYYNRWLFAPYKYVEIYEYKKGTLVIDIIDKKNKRVVWRGTTHDQVYKGMSKVDKKIKAAVKAMFKQYAEDSKWKRKDYVFRFQLS